MEFKSEFMRENFQGLDEKYKKVKDIPNDYDLITNSQDIKEVLDTIGKKKLIDDYSSLFVKVGDGDYDAVYGCESSVPKNNDSVDKLY